MQRLRQLTLFSLMLLTSLRCAACSKEPPAPSAAASKSSPFRIVAVLGDATRVAFIANIAAALHGHDQSDAAVAKCLIDYQGKAIEFVSAKSDDTRLDASLAWQSDSILLATNSQDGAMPIGRERALLARQMNAPSVAILFTNTTSVAGAVLPQEEAEMRSLLDLYRLNGQRALCFLDNKSAKSTPDETRRIGMDEIADWARNLPERPAIPALPHKLTNADLYVYALTTEEGIRPGFVMGLKTENIAILTRGLQVEGRLTCNPQLAPGDNGTCTFTAVSPSPFASADRVAIIRDGHIIAAGVIAQSGP